MHEFIREPADKQTAEQTADFGSGKLQSGFHNGTFLRLNDQHRSPAKQSRSHKIDKKIRDAHEPQATVVQNVIAEHLSERFVARILRSFRFYNRQMFKFLDGRQTDGFRRIAQPFPYPKAEKKADNRRNNKKQTPTAVFQQLGTGCAIPTATPLTGKQR